MAVTTVVVAAATVLALGLLKDVSMRTIDALCETSAIGVLISALFGGLKSDIQLLHQELVILQALLLAERLRPAQCDNTATNVLVLFWLRTVEDAAYYADNVLDEMSYRKIRLQVEGKMSRGGLGKALVGKLMSAPDALAFRKRIASKVKTFLSMTRKIYEEASRFGIKPVGLLGNDVMYHQPLPALTGNSEDVRACVVASDNVGRDQEEELIVDKLCCTEDDQDLSVVAIVGMPGIGKTTLARRAYYNSKVARHFPKRLWISVSDNFKLKRILNEMVESETKSSSELSNIDGIEDTLHSCLKERRFLLVLDDVRNVDAEIWKFMKDLLERVGGSVPPRVLVTTQNDEVVSVMNASLVHVLNRLCESDSRMLFEREAFPNKSPEQISNLSTIGERIVKKCNGVPLAIKALGGLLKSKDDKLEWEAVESSQVWGSDLGDNNYMVMPSLLLSFNYLPEAAKRCFTYCSVILPRGVSATEMTLVELWMAHGFLQQSELKSMEDHGKEIVKVLLHRYLLQVDKCDSFGEVISYRMHDLMHDLALYISKGTCLVVKYLDELSGASAAKHVCILENNMHALTDDTSTFRFPKLKLWSLFSFSRMPVSENVMNSLRVLTLTCGLTEVSAPIGRLKHLRYLDMSKNLFEVLPDSIGDVGHLQTLRLEHCGSLMKLPGHITKLINLRHLSTTKHVILPVGFGQLTDLQTLPMLNLQAEGWKVDELECLLNIGGALSIKGVEHIKGKEDAMQSNLSMISKISELELIWNKERSYEGEHGNDLTVMNGLQPHSNLKGLLVKNYSSKKFPPWLSNVPTFPSLRVVSLLHCKYCEHLPALGHLPSLQILTINGLSSLEKIGLGFYYNDEKNNMAGTGSERSIPFPKLKELRLLKMRNLRHWSGPQTTSKMLPFPCLEVLEIKGCPKLVTAPTHFPSLQKLSFQCVNSGKPLEMILSNRNELMHCTSLQQIQVSSCKELTDFPKTLQTFRSLEAFQVEDCNSVTSLPDMNRLLSLTRLVIQNCKNLRRPPIGLDRCTSTETLALSNCPNFDFFPNLASLNRLEKLVLRTFTKEKVIPNWLSSMSNLFSLDIGDLDKELDAFPNISPLPVSLRSLYIVGWPKIRSLPSQLCKFTQLERLALFCFDGVETLPAWMCKLSSLQILRIGQCNNIKFLPPKDDMQRLDKLRVLDIKSCPLLKERCIKDQGVEWDKIAHICRISIDNEDIQKPT